MSSSNKLPTTLLRKGDEFVGRYHLNTDYPPDDSFEVIQSARQVEVWLPRTKTCMAHDELDPASDTLVEGETCVIRCLDYTEDRDHGDGFSSGCIYILNRLPHEKPVVPTTTTPTPELVCAKGDSD
jgi:hypothetical protein